MARSTIDAIMISQRLDRAGADLVSLSEKLDTTSAAGKMIFRLLAVFAEFESDVISERTSAALQQLRRSGRRISGRVPYGYDLAADGRSLVANGAEQLAIQQIMLDRAQGVSLRAIAAKLNAAEVPTKLGRQWLASTIQAIVRNPSRQR